MQLIIADEEAFSSRRVWVVFLDGFRNIIRNTRVDMNEYDFENIIGGFMHTNGFGLDTIVGEKYRVGGELGKPLYQLNSDDGTSQIA